MKTRERLESWMNLERTSKIPLCGCLVAWNGRCGWRTLKTTWVRIFRWPRRRLRTPTFCHHRLLCLLHVSFVFCTFFTCGFPRAFQLMIDKRSPNSLQLCLFESDDPLIQLHRLNKFHPDSIDSSYMTLNHSFNLQEHNYS